MRYIKGLVLVTILLCSCVSNKKFVLLQKGDLNRKDLKKDTVLRSYKTNLTDYKIQPQDILSVRFESLTSKDYDFLNMNQVNLAAGAGIGIGGALLIGELVDLNGEIPIPVIGKVKVGNLTIFEIQDKLQNIVSKYLESPVVKVRLINFRITVLGEVHKEGVVSLNNNRVSLLEAIGWAGGLTDLADRGNVKLIRQVDGLATVQYIDILKEDFINSPYYYIYPNDILIVSSLKQRPARNYLGQNVALIATSLSLLFLLLTLKK